MTPDPQSPSDEELMRAFIDGDDQAYATLVERHQRRVYGICYRYFGDPQDAEDAAQTAFVTLYRRAKTFKFQSSFSTWMYRLTTNTCNDIGRRRSRRPKKSSAVVEELPLADSDNPIGNRMLRLDLQAALDEIDPTQRDAIIAHTVQGVPYADIAESTGVAVGTVKSRVHRGLARLAEIVGAADSENESEISSHQGEP